MEAIQRITQVGGHRHLYLADFPRLIQAKFQVLRQAIGRIAHPGIALIFGGTVLSIDHQRGGAGHRSEKAVWEDHEALPAFDTGSPLCAAVRELARMIRQFCLESPEGADRIARLEQRKEGDRSVQLAREFLETHFAEPIGVAEIARAALISPSYLKHLFKEQTGTTLMAELCDIRLRRACELLSRTDRGIREIALTVGFRDPDYFSAVFRKKRGETPLAYRRRKRREG